jgi:hypothetical protein
MHIKNIHCIIEKLAETTKVELDKGIENVDTKEMGEVADIIKDLAEAEYYAKISKAMDEAEYGEDYDYMGAYDEHERRGYKGQPRDSKGRYMSRRGRRMGYEEPIYMSDMYPMEHYRDMDRMDGRMYYTSGSMGTNSMGSQGQSSNGSSNMSGNRGYSDRMDRDNREGRSGERRRGYMEAKEKGMDKQSKMKELEEYMKELSSDVTEMINDASQEEKTMLKNKMQVLMQKIQ